MLDDLVMDATLQSHHEVARSRAVCHICHTRYVYSLVPAQTPRPNWYMQAVVQVPISMYQTSFYQP